MEYKDKEDEYSLFNLLVPRYSVESKLSLDLKIRDTYWTLEEQLIPIVQKKGTYTCISYSWGFEKESNPLYEGESMSRRVVPILETVLPTLINSADSINEVGKSSAIWIDAFCIPPTGKQREACLRSMGAIYGNAEKVLAILSPSSSTILEKLRNNNTLDMETLSLIEQDDWAMRAWTYQEIVNSSTIYFLAEGEDAPPVRGDIFFEEVVRVRNKFSEENGFGVFHMEAKFPSLMSFESVILDWKMDNYQQRSAYKVILSIQSRFMKQSSDLVYAMLGAITDTQIVDQNVFLTSPEEYLMQRCEAKNDFSFIYTTAKRSSVKGKSWRPVAESLQAVLPYTDCWGETQPGKLYPNYLQLHNVCLLQPGTFENNEKMEKLMKFCRIKSSDVPFDARVHLILDWLNQGGFTGCGEYIELENGLFFSQKSILNFKNLYVVASTEVRYVFGAPGLLVKKTGTDIFQYQDVGFFFGQLSNSTSIRLE